MIMAMKCMRLHGHGSTVCDGVRRGLAHRRVLVYKGLAVGTCRRKLQPRSVRMCARTETRRTFLVTTVRVWRMRTAYLGGA